MSADVEVINPNRNPALPLQRLLAMYGLTMADIYGGAETIGPYSRRAPGHVIAAYHRRSPAKRAKHLARGGR